MKGLELAGPPDDRTPAMSLQLWVGETGWKRPCRGHHGRSIGEAERIHCPSPLACRKTRAERGLSQYVNEENRYLRVLSRCLSGSQPERTCRGTHSLPGKAARRRLAGWSMPGLTGGCHFVYVKNNISTSAARVSPGCRLFGLNGPEGAATGIFDDLKGRDTDHAAGCSQRERACCKRGGLRGFLTGDTVERVTDMGLRRPSRHHAFLRPEDSIVASVVQNCLFSRPAQSRENVTCLVFLRIFTGMQFAWKVS